MIKRRETSRPLGNASGSWRDAPMEPILHASPWRLKLLGLTIMIGQPLFGWIWSIWLVQPYESGWLRGLMGVLGSVLLLPAMSRDFSRRSTNALITLVMWIELPLFFSWMYLNNYGSAAWLSTVCAVIVFYYHLTDWRIATAGIVSGALLAWTGFLWTVSSEPYVAQTGNLVDAVVIFFSWACALLLGLSSANLRREHLDHTLTTMGIMAHELRTPLSTVALIGDAIHLEIQRHPAHPRAAKLAELGQRLHILVRNMNHQIDTQTANARLLQLPGFTEQVSGAELVRKVVQAYPFPSSRQRDCVNVTIHGDFLFLASATQFSQVMDNLIKNALHSLATADSRYQPGALHIEVDCTPKHGRITVTDDGIGIESALLPQIFKPFFSSSRSTGHGLGLAFCQQVVRRAGGRIQVKSAHAMGAVFTVILPVLPPANRH